MNFALKIYILIKLFFSFSVAEAVEMYSVFDKSCNEHQGYFIGSDESNYSFLTVKGAYKQFEESDIKGVLVYNFVSPPISQIKVNKATTSKLKVLTVSNEGEVNSFSGFPIQFIEDLVVFLGSDGAVRVYKLDRVQKIRPAQALKAKLKKSVAKLDIKSSGYIQSCLKSGKNGNIRPNRILVDAIKIKQFLKSYRVGYDDLESFQERTYLYARPKLFTQKTRFGIISQDAVEQSSGNLNLDVLPFFEWSSGKFYGVQGHTQLIGVFDEFGADLDPFLGFRTEVKAHFFHASFTGNLAGLAAGTEHYLSRDPFSGSEIDKTVSEDFIDTALNYSAFVGGDYGPHSFSVGLYYPVEIVKTGAEVRELLSTSSSYAFRYMHTGKSLRLYAVVSLRDREVSAPTSENFIGFSSGSRLVPQAFSTSLFFIRSGVDWTLPKSTFLGVNALYLKYKYDESLQDSASLSRLGATAYARRTFGDYVSFGMRATYLSDDLSSNLGSNSLNLTNSNFEFGFEGGLVF